MAINLPLVTKVLNCFSFEMDIFNSFETLIFNIQYGNYLDVTLYSQ